MSVTTSQCIVLATVAFTSTLLATAAPVNNRPQDQCEEGKGQSSDAGVLLQLQSRTVYEEAASRKVNASAAPSALSTGSVLAQHHRGKTSIKTLYPYYHTGEEIRFKVQALSMDCGGAMKLETLSDNQTHIDVVKIRKPGSSPVNKVFLLFGEHARELISPESGLRLLEVLCGKAKVEGTEDLVPNVLLDSEFQIVLNANPKSRSSVENGEFCLRTNPNGVDLNRNWDVKWEALAGSETNAGLKPFSEPETRIFKRLVSEFKPTTFLTVHSGTKGMYMPYAYDSKHMGKYNKPLMLQILKDLDKQHCQCPFGAAGKEVGYDCPGTCLDWVYEELRTPYVFAFEIYVDADSEEALKKEWKQVYAQAPTSLLQSESHLGHEHFAELFKSHASDFVLRRRQDKMDVEDEIKKMKHQQEVDDRSYACFTMFNPKTEAEYNLNVQNWAVTYLEMAQKVATDIKTNRTHL